MDKVAEGLNKEVQDDFKRILEGMKKIYSAQQQKEEEKPRFDPLPIYKPNKKGTGGAVQFKLAVRTVKESGKPLRAVFVDAAKQVGSFEDKKFDWDNKIVMKMGLPDIGAMLSVLGKREDKIELMHKSPNGTSYFDLKKQDGTYKGYFLSIRQKPNDGQLKQVVLPITDAEASIIYAALTYSVPKMINW